MISFGMCMVVGVLGFVICTGKLYHLSDGFYNVCYRLAHNIVWSEKTLTTTCSAGLVFAAQIQSFAQICYATFRYFMQVLLEVKS